MIGGKYGKESPPAPIEGGDDDTGEEAGPSLGDMGAMRAAKALCSALGVDPGKAGAVSKALKAHYEACAE